MTGTRWAYVFGYGSLAGDEPVGAESPPIVHAAGLRRTWNVAMDNAMTLEGYKYYVDSGDAERPNVFVTFLNVVEDGSRSVNGILLCVDQAALGLLDDRERNYERREISDRIVESVDARVWVYLGSPEARQRYQEGVKRGTSVVDQHYYRQVRRQFRGLGSTAYAEYLASTDEPQCPLRDLQRVDL
jgi:hypothetical protein